MLRFAIGLVTIAVLMCGTAAGQCVNCLPIPMIAVSPAPALPPALQVSTFQPVTTFRWGILGRRLVPRTYFIPTAPVTYVPYQAQQANPAAN